MDVGYDNSVFIKHKTAAKKDLLKLEVIAKNEGIKSSSTVIVAQSIVKPLLSFAKSRKIDLIVMGSHGRTGLDKLFLGSIANGVLNRAHCPVLIIK
jgi:nucleotide-binding universal stress UspA family protein